MTNPNQYWSNQGTASGAESPDVLFKRLIELKHRLDTHSFNAVGAIIMLKKHADILVKGLPAYEIGEGKTYPDCFMGISLYVVNNEAEQLKKAEELQKLGVRAMLVGEPK